LYDKVTGVTKDTLKACLKQDIEAFGAGHRAMFTSALMLARKISMDETWPAITRRPKSPILRLSKRRRGAEAAFGLPPA
jgi:hypothetical protein